MKSMVRELALRLLPVLFIVLSIGCVDVASAQAATTHQTTASAGCVAGADYQNIAEDSTPHFSPLSGGDTQLSEPEIDLIRWKCKIDGGEHCSVFIDNDQAGLAVNVTVELKVFNAENQLVDLTRTNPNMTPSSPDLNTPSRRDGTRYECDSSGTDSEGTLGSVTV